MNLPLFNQFNGLFLATLFDIALRSSVLMTVAALLVWLFRSASAEARHLFWQAALHGLLILTVVEFAHYGASRQALETHWRWPQLAAAAYLAVAMVLFLRLGGALFRVRRLVANSEPILDAELREAILDAWLQGMSLVRPRVRISRDVNVPMAVNAGEPLILLPEVSRTWDADKLRAVLLHEMAHVRRNDSATAFFASVAICLFWPHPLAYWLRSQLSSLGEEAADESTLQSIPADQYSRILIDLAATVGVAQRRVVTACGVVTGQSRISKRLEKIYSLPARRGSGYRWAQAAILLVFCPLFFLAAVPQTASQSKPPISIANSEQARTIESQLERNPEDLAARSALMAFYWNTRQVTALANHRLWMIEHHPDDGMAAMPIRPRENEANHELLKAAWERALSVYGSSPDVLRNAALFLASDDPQRSIDLLRKATAMVPPHSIGRRVYLSSLAAIYAAAVIMVEDPQPANHLPYIGLTPNAASQLKAELDASTDPEFLIEVGASLVQRHRDATGLAYMHKANDLDPSNAAFITSVESAEAEPVRRKNREILAHSNAVRVSSAVAEANLLTAPEPQYPPLARQAGVEGDVEFSVEIGLDGQVQRMELVRGNPLLVDAARNAVLGRTYRPTLLNGNPVAVSTTVMVPFRLP